MTASKRPRPTQRTIATAAGVSVGTVSRALSNDPLIAEDTRALVHRIASELGYAPDRAAQRLRTGRTNVICLVLSPHDEILGFGTSVVRGITQVLKSTPYHLVVMPDFEGSEAEEAIGRLVRNKMADGVIFSRTTPDDSRVRHLLEADFPFVCHGRTELATPHPWVDFDNYDFARRAAMQLVGQGAERLAILLPPERFTFRNYLQHGFMTTVRETGVAYEQISGATLDSPGEEIEAAIHARFSQIDRPDGLILPGETSALAALAALQDLGLKPGVDVHLVAKQTSGVFGFVRPRVPSLTEDLTAAGSAMAELLLQRLDGAATESLTYLQPVTEAPNT